MATNEHRVSGIDTEGLDDATIDRLLAITDMTPELFESLPKIERRIWFRLKYRFVGSDASRRKPGLTMSDLARLSMLPATPEAEHDAYLQDLHDKLHSPRSTG